MPRQSVPEASARSALGVRVPRALLEATLDLFPVPAVLVEQGTARMVFANRAARALAGGGFPLAGSGAEYDRLYRLTDAAGHAIPSDRHPAVRAARGERLDGEQVEWHLPDGTSSLLVSSEAVPGAGEEEAVVLVAFEDVSPITRAQARARAAQGLLETFFA